MNSLYVVYPRCLSRKADHAEAVEADLATAKTGLAAKTVELAEIQEKLNDNYQLVAKLSSENLKLSGEKVRADELVAQVPTKSSTFQASST